MRKRPEPEIAPLLVSQRVAGKLLDAGRSTVQKLGKRGEIEIIDVNGRRPVVVASIHALIERRKRRAGGAACIARYCYRLDGDTITRHGLFLTRVGPMSSPDRQELTTFLETAEERAFAAGKQEAEEQVRAIVDSSGLDDCDWRDDGDWEG